MTHVDGMSTIQVGHPFLQIVLMKADNLPQQLIVPWQ